MEGLVYCYVTPVSKGQAAVFLEFPGQHLSLLQGPWLSHDCACTCCSFGLQGSGKWPSELPTAVPSALDLAACTSHWFY